MGVLAAVGVATVVVVLVLVVWAAFSSPDSLVESGSSGAGKELAVTAVTTRVLMTIASPLRYVGVCMYAGMYACMLVCMHAYV